MKISVFSGEVIGSFDDVKTIVDIIDDKVLVNDDAIAIEERI